MNDERFAPTHVMHAVPYDSPVNQHADMRMSAYPPPPNKGYHPTPSYATNDLQMLPPYNAVNSSPTYFPLAETELQRDVHISTTMMHTDEMNIGTRRRELEPIHVATSQIDSLDCLAPVRETISSTVACVAGGIKTGVGFVAGNIASACKFVVRKIIKPSNEEIANESIAKIQGEIDKLNEGLNKARDDAKRLRGDARSKLKDGNKTMAKTLIAQAMALDESAKKIEQLILNQTKTLIGIQQAAQQFSIMDAQQTVVAAQKRLNERIGGVDNVIALRGKLEEEMSAANEVSNALSEPIIIQNQGEYDDDMVEAELAEMESEEEVKEPNVVVNIVPSPSQKKKKATSPSRRQTQDAKKGDFILDEDNVVVDLGGINDSVEEEEVTKENVGLINGKTKSEKQIEKNLGKKATIM